MDDLDLVNVISILNNEHYIADRVYFTRIINFGVKRVKLSSNHIDLTVMMMTTHKERTLTVQIYENNILRISNV